MYFILFESQKSVTSTSNLSVALGHKNIIGCLTGARTRAPVWLVGVFLKISDYTLDLKVHLLELRCNTSCCILEVQNSTKFTTLRTAACTIIGTFLWIKVDIDAKRI